MAEGVSLLSQRHVSAHRDPHADMETVNVCVPTAKYTKMGETLRHVIPGHMQCSMACGGRACKYENASRWSDEEQAVKGLYSSWITDHLLAMARPSTETIEKFNVIKQFQLCDLRTVVNLQRPGEHASCGSALEPVSGFTYRPEVFMEAGIFFYNFGWKDYGVASLTTILDMVKVMSFAMQEGKIAVHCHAGLGRTGVLIACFLVFTSRMSADQAILFVRAKRPNSIQTRGQLLCVREFAQFLVPLRSVFSCAEPKAHSVTLSQYLIRQRHLLHGYEARHMKNLPKIVHLVCRLLLDIAEDRPTVGEEVLEIPDLTEEVEKTVSLQAIRQLGKEMQGKGIPSFPPKPLLGGEQEFDVLLDVSSTSQLLRRKSLSYSDSALNNLDSRLQRLQCSSDALGSKSGSSFTELCTSQGRLDAQTPDLLQCVSLTSGSDSSVQHGSVVPSCYSLEQAAKVQASCSPLPFNRVPLKEVKRSMSYGLLEGDSLHRSTALSQYSGEHARDGPKATNHLDHDQTTEDGRFEIPIFTFQSELTPETRHQLVAKALTMDLQREDLRNTVSMWQTEVNSREGAWERLCSERDPVVLSALLWSWLEQLKEPAIAKEDLKALTENRCHPQQAVSSLEKGQRETLLCVLDCVAHLLKIPESIESALIERTIKAFTWISSSSENERIIYTTLKDVMTHLLRDLRLKVTEETEMNT